MDEAHALVYIEDVCAQGLQFLQHLAKEVNGGKKIVHSTHQSLL